MPRQVITRTRNADLGKPRIVRIDKKFRGIKMATGQAGETQSILFDKYNYQSIHTSQDVHTETLGTAHANGTKRKAYINAIGNRVFEVSGGNSGLISKNPMPY